MPPRPRPVTATAWAEEALAIVAMDPCPEPYPAAVAARGWSISAAFLDSLRELSVADAQRLTEVWEHPAERPAQVFWVAQYLAGQVHLGHLPAAAAAAVMEEVVTHLGGTAVPVALPDPEVADVDVDNPNDRGSP